MKRIVLTVLMAAVAWGSWAQSAAKPVETDFKSDVCAQCQMAVTSTRYAAEIVGPAKPLFFDDIGCLVQYERQAKVDSKTVQGRFVRDALGTTWLAVDQAVWVLAKGVRTPMGYGFHAFADQKSADEFLVAKAQAKVLTWAEVRAAVPAGMGKM